MTIISLSRLLRRPAIWLALSLLGGIAAAQSNVVDASFSAAPNDTVKCISVQPDGKVIIGGFFLSVAGSNTTQFARLNTNGTLDTTFTSRVDNTVLQTLVQPDGKIIAGGRFDTVNFTPRTQVARVLTNGVLDTGFVPPALASFFGGDAVVYALAQQADGKILVGGEIGSAGGVTRRGVVRLHTNGTFDTTFTNGTGPDYAFRPVHTLAVQTDQKIIVAGEFTTFNNTNRPGIARLNTNATLDITFVPQLRSDSTVEAAALDASNRVVLAGTLRNPAGTLLPNPQRLLSDGSLDSGFNVGTGANGFVSQVAVDSAGAIVIAGSFTAFNGTNRAGVARLFASGALDVTFGSSNTMPSVDALAVQANRRVLIGGYFSDVAGIPRTNIARLHRSGPGTLRFATNSMVTTENSGTVQVQVTRVNGDSGSVTVNYATSNATAIAGSDYTASSGTLTFTDAVTNQNLSVPLLNNGTYEDPETFSIFLSNPGGGAVLETPTNVTVTILDDEPPPSTVQFEAVSYAVQESIGLALLTVVRTGDTNPVTVAFATSNLTATAGSDYTATNGVLSFGTSDTVKQIAVPILDSYTIEGNESLMVRLSALTGAAIGVNSNATITILDTAHSPEDLYGHGLIIVSNVNLLLTNGPPLTFSNRLTISNPSQTASSNGYVQITGSLAASATNRFHFTSIPAGGQSNVIVGGLTTLNGSLSDTNSYPFYGTVYEVLGVVTQAQHSVQIFIATNTAPPNGGVPIGGSGPPAPGFMLPPHPTNVVVSGPLYVLETTLADYAASANFSDGSTHTNVTPTWTSSVFSISAAGRFTAGSVTSDLPATISARVNFGTNQVTGNLPVTVADQRDTQLEILPLTNANARLLLRGTTGKFFVLDATTNLASAPWTAVATNQIASNSSLSLTDSNAGTNTQRLYRARQQP